MHTPNALMNVIKATQGHKDISQVLPTKQGWNTWVHLTKNGNPYLVLQCKGTKFSISRVRRSSYAQWSYLVRWPFPSSFQQSIELSSPTLIADIIRSNAE